MSSTLVDLQAPLSRPSQLSEDPMGLPQRDVGERAREAEAGGLTVIGDDSRTVAILF